MSRSRGAAGDPFEFDPKVFHERIETRMELKNFVYKIQEGRHELRDPSSTRFIENLSALNDISAEATHTRELQIDALALKELSFAAKAQANRLNDLSRKYDFNAFGSCIRQLFAGPAGTLNWVELGHAVSTLSYFSPPQSTMLGPLAKEVKVRKATVRTAHKAENEEAINADAAKPTEFKYDDIDQDDAVAMQRSSIQLEHLARQQQQRQNQRDAGTNLVDFLVDPDDLVQTVENFFDYSFLLKDKKVAEDINPRTGLPEVVRADPNALQDETKKQMVLAINMGDLQRLANALKKRQQSQKGTDRPVDAAKTTASSQPTSNNNNDSQRAPKHHLHREDPMYTGRNVVEQVNLLNERAAKRHKR